MLEHENSNSGTNIAENENPFVFLTTGISSTFDPIISSSL
jgi:hypothetical protein